jgi:hypothetical protein|tara:strand:- start:1796 stop:1999 length:204 start_codon:yes stop_codon:yes gene_type:complete
VDGVRLAEYILKELRNRQGQISEQLCGGLVKTMEDYRFLMGELTALRSFESDLKEVLQKTTGDSFDE